MIRISESKMGAFVALELDDKSLILSRKQTKAEALNLAIDYLEQQLVELRKYYHDIPVDKR